MKSRTMQSNFFKNRTTDKNNSQEHKSGELIAKYKKLGIYSIYEKLFIDLEEKMNQLKVQLSKNDIPAWKVEAAVEQAKKEGQIDIICQMQEQYEKIVDELEKNQEPASPNGNSSP